MLVSRELDSGNEIQTIEVEKWTNIDKVVAFKRKFQSINAQMGNDFIEYWENHDTHYAVQNGYVCRACKCAIAFPLEKN